MIHIASSSRSSYGSEMDALASLLHGPRAEGVFVLRSLMNPPWSVFVDDRAALSLIALTRGEAWVVADGEQPQRIDAGSIVIVRGPEPYTFADRPDRPPQVIIEEGQRCVTVDGVPMHEAMSLGVRTWGNDAHGATAMLIGAYERVGRDGRSADGGSPATARAPSRRMVVPVPADPRRRDQPRRARTAGRARPPRRPRIGVSAARLADARRWRADRVVPRPRRPGRGAGAPPR